MVLVYNMISTLVDSKIISRFFCQEIFVALYVFLFALRYPYNPSTQSVYRVKYRGPIENQTEPRFRTRKIFDEDFGLSGDHFFWS